MKRFFKTGGMHTHTLCPRRIETFSKRLFLCPKHAKTTHYVVLACMRHENNLFKKVSILLGHSVCRTCECTYFLLKFMFFSLIIITKYTIV